MGILDLILGPNFIGIFLNVFLYGVMLTQCLTYFRAFKDDRKGVRRLVWFLLVADTANTAFLAVVLYQDLISNFGNLESVGRVNWRATTSPLFNAIISACVQGFFARRVYVFAPFWSLNGIICAGIVVQAASGITVSIMGNLVPNSAEWGELRVKVPIVIWLVSAASVDVTITASLYRFLKRSKTGLITMDTLISKLIRSTVHTGMITAIAALLNLILYLASPYPLHLIFNLPLAKLYTNTFLSTLNARTSMREDLNSQKNRSLRVPQLSVQADTKGFWSTRDSMTSCADVDDYRGQGSTASLGDVEMTTRIPHTSSADALPGAKHIPDPDNESPAPSQPEEEPPLSPHGIKSSTIPIPSEQESYRISLEVLADSMWLYPEMLRRPS
ncbi:hypothetical protein JAAARDRAFT_73945 [Jaapia argillacea MUCL 33604]|uniref:DUF6534 domain-containing protein n=1 Tax=Jaapia argillacea MUCL 33604 TaxID=933084 RepID=A0A067PIM2_9AGAM|nr:hypothetical protein JAAARDRAFT_73945 [Jaapia argillacea MUCL 33604]